MSSFASTAGWNAGPAQRACGRSPRRGWEIAGIIVAFIFAWPLALAYLVWKFTGYPVPNQAREFFEQNFTRLSAVPFRAGPRYRPTGNLAFDEYRRSELDRLEQERRKLEEEAHAFSDFVEELKRAKDREEFDAFMARRRGSSAA